MWGALAVSCRMKEIEGARTVQLVYISGLLRMGNDSLLVPVWRFVGDGFSGVASVGGQGMYLTAREPP